MDAPPKFEKGVRRVGVEACSVEGCERRLVGLGLCGMHYQRLKTTGSVGTAEPIRRANGQGNLSRGYVDMQINYRRIGQHRLVMEEMIGRPLNPHEHVHHKNGIRSDNRPENLELWVKGHPFGQRPEDLIAFVVQFYRDEVEQALVATNQEGANL
jgi:hypothetical protein